MLQSYDFRFSYLSLIFHMKCLLLVLSFYFFIFYFLFQINSSETIHRAVNGHVARNIKYKNINSNPRAEKSRASGSRGD